MEEKRSSFREKRRALESEFEPYAHCCVECTRDIDAMRVKLCANPEELLDALAMHQNAAELKTALESVQDADFGLDKELALNIVSCMDDFI
jgi:hypothetical protein